MLNFYFCYKVFVPPGYGQDVKSWAAALPGTAVVIKDASKVMHELTLQKPGHALFMV